MTINQALERTIKKLKKSSPTPQLDAEILLSHILKKPREWLLAHPEEELSEKLVTSYELLVTRRSLNEPIAYIVGYKDFYGLQFEVNENVLIPRPETELMVERGLSVLNKVFSNTLLNKKITVIDVGTGSGCTIVSIVKTILNENPLSSPFKKGGNRGIFRFLGTDISGDALRVAKKNAERHQLSAEIEFIHGDLLGPIIKNYKLKIKNSSLLVLANLPYVSQGLYKKTEKDIQNFEPKTALTSGPDGLDHYRKLLDQLKMFHVPCYVLCEISPEQKEKMEKEISQKFPGTKIKFHKDLAGKWRLVEFSF